eukprot:TRINITY_DN38096_c0_g1_i1.p1 TRINITY_DN38096_c0_g1~~TRINITY_DN38096_c0_g1_i1.p1  ORF type:complete len:314 (-),score=60.35 TRINITY_DN38096_c0_g1_i1:55-996(-)
MIYDGSFLETYKRNPFSDSELTEERVKGAKHNLEESTKIATALMKRLNWNATDVKQGSKSMNWCSKSSRLGTQPLTLPDALIQSHKAAEQIHAVTWLPVVEDGCIYHEVTTVLNIISSEARGANKADNSWKKKVANKLRRDITAYQKAGNHTKASKSTVSFYKVFDPHGHDFELVEKLMPLFGEPCAELSQISGFLQTFIDLSKFPDALLQNTIRDHRQNMIEALIRKIDKVEVSRPDSITGEIFDSSKHISKLMEDPNLSSSKLEELVGGLRKLVAQRAEEQACDWLKEHKIELDEMADEIVLNLQCTIPSF